MRKLTLALVALVLVATAAPMALPIGMKAEWDTYWNGMMNKYLFTSGNAALDYDAPFLCDTFTIPQGRVRDTMVCTSGGYYNFFYTDGETKNIALSAYKTWDGTNIAVFGPDSSPTLFPGYLGPNVIIYVAAADTGAATSVTRIFWKYKPAER